VQSLSFVALHPVGQQLSSFAHDVIFEPWHDAVHVPGLSNVWILQPFGAAHDVGHGFGLFMPGSHVSPVSTVPLPHTLSPQSGSVTAVQVDGQHWSAVMLHVLIAFFASTQCAEHGLVLSMTTEYCSQPTFAHVCGQFPSQISPSSTIPFPQTAVQSVSFVDAQPVGQHPSPLRQVV
jgi:hypothetical protein